MKYYCASCDNIGDGSCGHIGLTIIEEYKMKMTRKEAIKKVVVAGNVGDPLTFVKGLEALGLLKFEEEKEIFKIFQLDNKNGAAEWNTDYAPDRSVSLNNLVNKYGTIRLEEWPEGLVLWVGGKIVYKSWEKVYKIGDRVSLHDNFGGCVSGIIKSPGG